MVNCYLFIKFYSWNHPNSHSRRKEQGKRLTKWKISRIFFFFFFCGCWINEGKTMKHKEPFISKSVDSTTKTIKSQAIRTQEMILNANICFSFFHCVLFRKKTRCQKDIDMCMQCALLCINWKWKSIITNEFKWKRKNKIGEKYAAKWLAA